MTLTNVRKQNHNTLIITVEHWNLAIFFYLIYFFIVII